jgi:cell division transport system permease protein
MISPKRQSGAQQRTPSRTGTLAAKRQDHRRAISQSVDKLSSTPSASVMTIMVIAIALLLPATLFVVMDNLKSMSGGLGSVSQISLYLQDGLPESEAENLSKQLLTRPDINASEYISPTRAATEFAAYSGLGDIMAVLEENPLPAVIVVEAASIDHAVAARLAEELSNLPEVQSTQLDLEWIERLQRFLQLAERASTGLMLILALAVVFIMGNTIRLAIESRRAEIVVIKLVGGTDAYVALPFLYTGAICGLAGGMLAWALLGLVMLTLQGPANNLLVLYQSEYRVHGLSLASGLLLLACSTCLGWLGAMISIRQHLSAIEPR